MKEILKFVELVEYKIHLEIFKIKRVLLEN